MSENNKYWVRWLVASLWAILVIALTTIGNGVVTNDREARARDSEIIEKAKAKDDELCEQNNQTQQEVVAIKQDIQWIKQTQVESKETLKEILKYVKQ